MKQPLLNNDNICKEINLKGPLKNIFKIIRENENTSVQNYYVVFFKLTSRKSKSATTLATNNVRMRRDIFWNRPGTCVTVSVSCCVYIRYR